MLQVIFSIPRCAARPPTNMIPCTRNARTLDSEGETIAFAHTERKFTNPYNWLSSPANPMIHTTSAGICKTRTPLIETSHELHSLVCYKSSPAEAHGDFPISMAAVRELGVSA